MTCKRLKEFDESKRKFVLPKQAHLDLALLPVIQNILAMGGTEADVGMIVGFQGEDARDWLHNRAKSSEDVKLAIKAGHRMANALLVAQMFRSAIGYDYDETVDEYKYYDHAGTKLKKPVKVSTKVYKKHQPGNALLATFLSENRMPDLFKRRVELTKKNLNFNVDVEATADQIAELAGKVVEFANERKQIKSTVIDLGPEQLDRAAQEDARRESKPSQDSLPVL